MQQPQKQLYVEARQWRKSGERRSRRRGDGGGGGGGRMWMSAGELSVALVGGLVVDMLYIQRNNHVHCI